VRGVLTFVRYICIKLKFLYFPPFDFVVKCYLDKFLTGLVKFTVLSIITWSLKCCTRYSDDYNLCVCTIIRLVKIIHT